METSFFKREKLVTQYNEKKVHFNHEKLFTKKWRENSEENRTQVHSRRDGFRKYLQTLQKHYESKCAKWQKRKRRRRKEDYVIVEVFLKIAVEIIMIMIPRYRKHKLTVTM